MTSNSWQWTPSIVPEIGTDYFRDSSFRAIAQPDTAFTVGGVVSRLVGLSESPLFILATPSAVIAAEATETARAAVRALMDGREFPAYDFVPVVGDGGTYPLEVVGLTVSVSCLEGGVEIPSNDPRRVVLTPAMPRFNASSVVNRIGDALAVGGDWFLILDQHSGVVSACSVGTSNLLSQALAVSGVSPLAAFNVVLTSFE